jgi:hypothetical protein
LFTANSPYSLVDTSYAIAFAAGPLACGSKVLTVSLFLVFALYERKNEKQ